MVSIGCSARGRDLQDSWADGLGGVRGAKSGRSSSEAEWRSAVRVDGVGAPRCRTNRAGPALRRAGVAGVEFVGFRGVGLVHAAKCSLRQGTPT
jgi:hypothetical protein